MSDDPVAGTPAAPPVEPTPGGGPNASWPHRRLYERVVDALHALPDSFRTSLNITGVRVADLYTLNSALGASIEQSVVDNLNALRPIWDPDNQYQLYSFLRQNQVFPDVLLQSTAPQATSPIILGVELKGWFALAKEGEPSFRYTVNPEACADADLLVVFPWILDEVVSGRPRLMQPFVVEARYAASHRNHYWIHLRGVSGPATTVLSAEHRQPYPRKSDKYLDRAASDAGGNFGRIARGQIMDAYIARLNSHPVAGIPLGAWQRFFKIFTDAHTEASLQRQLAVIERSFRDNGSPAAREKLDHLIAAIIALFEPDA